MPNTRRGARRRLNLDEKVVSEKDDNVQIITPPSSSRKEKEEGATATTPSVPGTPHKKRKIDRFLTPPQKTAPVSSSFSYSSSSQKPHEKAERDHYRERKQRKKQNYSIKSAEQQQQTHDDKYVPIHIHKNVGYVREDLANVDDVTRKVYKFIQNKFVIPLDLETSRSYGPLSGSCYQERVITAYTLGRLQRKEGIEADDEKESRICSYCGEEGHMRVECPQLI